MSTLEDTVALVTGGTRGIGRGIALALADRGATVYVTGRTRTEGSGAVPVDGSLAGTVAAAPAGRVVAVACDHADDRQSAGAVRRVVAEHGRIDVLVNNAWAGYEGYATGTAGPPDQPFWEKPLSWWDVNQAGPRWSYVVTRAAAPALVAAGRGVVVTTSFTCDPGDPAYGVAKTSSNRLVEEWQAALGPSGVVSVGVHPGLVSTEIVALNAQYFDMSEAQSPRHVGDAVAALVGDSGVERWGGRCCTVAGLAKHYGLTDPEPWA